MVPIIADVGEGPADVRTAQGIHSSVSWFKTCRVTIAVNPKAYVARGSKLRFSEAGTTGSLLM